MFLPRLSACVLAFLAFLAPRFLSAQIRADVTVAGGVNGTFTIDLEHTKVPTTVANFIGLATGQRPWIDYASGSIRTTPFYTGVTFHRVIAGFMNQTGSRNGVGTDGPGYAFKDEFDPTLRHDAAYVVSMANSGKHTNGSQIFITVSPQAQLNDKHSVFGHVIAGQAVIDAINVTPTGAGDVPVTPIAIQSITVYGASLAGFDLFPSSLPTVLNAHPVLSKSGTTFTLAYDGLPYSAYTGYRGGDLSVWSQFKASYAGGSAASGSEDVTALATGLRHFFRMARIDYSTTTAGFIPASLANRSFTLTSNFPYPIVVTLDATGFGGTWELTGLGSGTLHTVIYYPPNRYTVEVYLRFNSTPNFGFDIQLRPTLDYTSANGGAFTGPTNISGYTTMTGTFTTPLLAMPRYWGAVTDPSLTNEQIKTILSSDLSTTRAKNVEIPVLVDSYVYYLYPAIFGDLTDVRLGSPTSPFNSIGGRTPKTTQYVTVTPGADPILYNVYRTNNQYLAGSTTTHYMQ